MTLRREASPADPIPSVAMILLTAFIVFMIGEVVGFEIGVRSPRPDRVLCIHPSPVGAP